MARSLPGMTRDEKITVSPRSSTICACSSAAMRAKRRARLALAAGAEQQHLVARQIGRLLLGEEGRNVLEIAGLARGALDAPQRAADQRDVAVVRRGGDSGGSRAAPRSRRSTAMATRFWQRPTRSMSERRTSASEPESPGRSALVESQIMASTPASPKRASAAMSAAGPISGSGSSFQSPVWSTAPKRRAEHDGVGLGDRMGEGHAIRARTGRS